MTVIKLENVSYAYDEQQILKDINLEVEAGQVVAILGPSGVGKSTLFNLIAGILEVQSGRIVLDGQENPADGQLTFARKEFNYSMWSF